MSEINGYVRVKKVYATTDDEVTLIVEPIDGAIPHNGVKMPDGTYRVVWSMKYLKNLIREYVIDNVMTTFVEENEPLHVNATSFGTYFDGDTVLGDIINFASGTRPPLYGPDDGVAPVSPDFPGGSGTGNNS